MRTSLEEIKSAEEIILSDRTGSTELLNVTQRVNLAAQRIAYFLVKAYGRRQLKHRIAKVEESLFSDGMHIHFQNQVKEIFKH